MKDGYTPQLVIVLNRGDEMSQKKRTTDADRASGYVREVAETAKAGVDHASNYLEGMTDRTVDYLRGTASDTQDKVAELGSRRLDDLWAGTLRSTKRQPATALLIAISTGLALGLMVNRDR